MADLEKKQLFTQLQTTSTRSSVFPAQVPWAGVFDEGTAVRSVADVGSYLGHQKKDGFKESKL